MVRRPCCSYVGMNRGPWTPEEDLRLTQYIQIHGEGNWRTLPMKAGLLRCGKGCRLRWLNYLRPDVKRGHISPDEEDIIIRLHKLVGNRWSLIARRIPGRTDNEIKNYWNSHLSKRLNATKIQPAHKQPSSQDKNDSAFFRIEEMASILLGKDEIYNARTHASKDAVEPIQNFKQIVDGSVELTAINDFSNVLNNVDSAPWPYGDHPFSSMAMPCNFPPPFISSAGYENITDMFFTENINYVENLAGSESNMQLHSPMLIAESNIQFPSCPNEIDDSFTVDYDKLAEAKIGKSMFVNSNTITEECWEPFSAVSDWLDAANDYTFNVADYC